MSRQYSRASQMMPWRGDHDLPNRRFLRLMASALLDAAVPHQACEPSSAALGRLIGAQW